MVVIVVIALVIVAGMVFLLRSPPPKPAAPTWSEQDAAALREAVAARLRERLEGWTLDAPADKPLVLVATEAGTERRIHMDLRQLAESWFPLHGQGSAEADELVESFVAGVTGQGEGSDDEVNASELRDLLALRLLPSERVPPVGLSRPAGELRAVLVRRDRGGADLVTAEDLAAMGLAPGEAFGIALENLKRDVEEGLEVEPLDDGNPPGAVALAPHDPLAASYALVPLLAEKIRKVVKREAQIYLDEESLTAAVDGVEIEREKPLVAGALTPGALAWNSVPD